MNPVYPRDTDSPFPRQSDAEITQLTYFFFGVCALLLVLSVGGAILMHWLMGCRIGLDG